MATTTTNFGWDIPQSTDLVKDGATAIAALGQDIDTSMVDLKGGTTGQVLSKTSNTDMDFTWTSPTTGDITGVTAGTGISGGGTSGDVTITNSMATAIDAKGDLIAGTGADAFSRLAVGTNGQVLKADSTTSTGLTWGSAAATKNYSLLNAGGTNLTGAATITVSGISGIDEILVLVIGASSASAGSTFSMRFNADSGTNYSYGGSYSVGDSTYSKDVFGREDGTSATSFIWAKMGSNAASLASGGLRLFGTNTSGVKPMISIGSANAATGTGQTMYHLMGVWNNSATVSSVSILSDSGNFDAGKIYVYGAA